MTAQLLDTLFLGALTYLAHSTVLLGLGLAITSFGIMKNHNLREMILKIALFGGLVTTPIHLSGILRSKVFALPEETIKSEPAPIRFESQDRPQEFFAQPEPTANKTNDPEIIGTPVISTALEKAETRLNVMTSDPKAEKTTFVEKESGLSLNYADYTLLAWLFLGLAFLVQLGALGFALKAQLSGRKQVQNKDVLTLSKKLARDFGIDVPALSTKKNLAGPFCLGRGEIVLPVWALDLPSHQLKALLAHEMAHLKRKDPHWLLAGRFVQSLLFFQPLNFIALRRIQAISEFSCDAWARRLCGSGMPLAECLAECAKRHLGRAPSALGAAMATKRSPIVERTQMLLNNVADYSKDPSPLAKTLVIGFFVAAAAFFPVFGFDTLPQNALAHEEDNVPPPPAPEKPGAVVVDEIAGAHAVVDSDHTFTFAETPEITAVVTVDETPPARPADPVPAPEPVLTADASDSTSSYILVNDDGFTEIKISYTNEDSTLKINGKGKFRFNDEETEIVDLSKDGFLDIRETRDGKTRRVRFEDDNGDVSETFWLNGNEVEKDATTQNWLTHIIPEVYRKTGMDAERRTKRIFDKGGVNAVLDEIELINGSYAKRSYATHLTKLDELSDAESKRFMDTVTKISGSYDLRETLGAYTENQTPSEAEWGLFSKAARSISGSYDLRETLSSAARDFKGPKENWRYLLETAAGISSSFDLRETLISFKRSMPKDDATIEQLARVALEISSSYDLRETLTTFADEGGFGEKGWLALLNAAGEISSSYDKRATLEEFADTMPRNATLVAKYREIVDTISSDYDQRQALEALE